MSKKFTLSALLVAMTGIFLTACGEKPANQTNAPAGTSESSTTLAADAPLASVQEITINNGAEPESLDPHKVSGVPESNILRQMLVGLTTTDIDGNTVAGMATEWTSPDNKVWTFKLRDAKWSNGDPVTAQDFVYSLRRLVDPQTASPYSSYLADILVVNAQDIIDGKLPTDQLGVKAIDDKTLEITLSEPVPYLPDALIHTSVKPVNQKVVEAHGDKWAAVGNFVGNGAYGLEDWQINERIVLVRNPSYYDDANTTINKITLLAVTDDVADVNRYKTGEIDITATVPETMFTQLKNELGDQVKVEPKLCTYYYEFNQTKPPFNDARVRRALSLAIDRDIITNNILGQGQTPAYQLTPTMTQKMKNNTPEWQNWDKAKRIEEAKKLLAEAGYSDSNPLKFELLYNTSDSHKKLASAVASFWKDSLGFVDVSLVNQEWKTYLETKRKQNFAAARAGWCADYNEPSSFLNIFKSNNSQNSGKYASPAFDQLMAQTLSVNVDDNARADLYAKAEAQLDQDAAAAMVYHYVGTRLVKPYVVGYSSKDPQETWQVKNFKILQH